MVDSEIRRRGHDLVIFSVWSDLICEDKVVGGDALGVIRITCCGGAPGPQSLISASCRGSVK